jgi:hypothetical protein
VASWRGRQRWVKSSTQSLFGATAIRDAELRVKKRFSQNENEMNIIVGGKEIVCILGVGSVVIQELI